MITSFLSMHILVLDDLGYLFCNLSETCILLFIVYLVICFHRYSEFNRVDAPKPIYARDRKYYEGVVPGHEITPHEWKRNRFAYDLWYHKTDRSIPFREWFRQQNDNDCTLIKEWRSLNTNILPSYPWGNYTLFQPTKKKPMTAKERAELKRKGKWVDYDL